MLIKIKLIVCMYNIYNYHSPNKNPSYATVKA